MPRPFTDLGSRSIRFSSFKIFSETAGLIEPKLHLEPTLGLEIKVCLWDLGHMTKMAVMPIYSKKDLKFFISGIERPMTLKLGL